MKTHCMTFLGLLPVFSSYNTHKHPGLPKPRVLRWRDAINQSIANAHILKQPFPRFPWLTV